jgi:hypothetical protein
LPLATESLTATALSRIESGACCSAGIWGVCSMSELPESFPAPENFFSKTSSVRKATPFLGAETIFGQVFGRGGMSNFQNPKVPPTGGSHLLHAHPSSFEMRQTVPVPTRAVPATGANPR